MIKKLFKKVFPVYIRLWPTMYWLAAWSAPDYSVGQTDWQALRVTLRSGEYHHRLVKTIKKGIYEHPIS